MRATLFFLGVAHYIIQSSSAAISSSSKSSLICGQNGWDLGHESFRSVTDGTPAVQTYSSCLSLCKSFSNCASVAFNPGDCELYDIAATGNFVADASSPYRFYDVGCDTQQFTQCGVSGWSRHDSIYYSNGLESIDQCFWDCQYSPSCASWAYGNNECFNFEKSIADNVNPDTKSPYKFYDQLCTFPVSTSTTTTTMSTSTKSTATKSSTKSQSTTSTKSNPSSAAAKTTTTTTTTSAKKGITTTASTAKAPTTTTTKAASTPTTTTTTSKPSSTSKSTTTTTSTATY